jgi:hypothetical protein
MTSNSIIRLTRWTPVLSFVGGLVILIAYISTYNIDVAVFGLRYLLCALIFNLLMLCLVCFWAYRMKEQRSLLKGGVIMQLVNVPVAAGFVLFGNWISNTVSLTLENCTNDPITEIAVLGCDKRFIKRLTPGETEYFLLQIPGDCSIAVEYTSMGQKGSAVVTSYVSRGGGFKYHLKLEKPEQSLEQMP